MNSSKVEFRDNCIDLIRLIAAIVVMFSHSLRWFGVEKPVWGLFFTDGSVGVISFNVLSGFLIFASWERCKNSFGSVTSQIKKYVCNKLAYLKITKIGCFTTIKISICKEDYYIIWF